MHATEHGFLVPKDGGNGLELPSLKILLAWVLFPPQAPGRIASLSRRSETQDLKSADLIVAVRY